MEPRCRSGGTGRRTGLKILRDLYSRTGSIPVFGTIFNIAEWSSWQLVGLITRRSQVQVLSPQPFKYYGSLVKRSRHRPFTAVTGVRFPYESPIWDHSSAGRAPALQAGGHRFEPCWSHHFLCGLVVQLVRMPACHAGGRGFESLPGRQFNMLVWLNGRAADL